MEEEGRLGPKVELRKSWSVVMTDELYCLLPSELRLSFDNEKAIFNDWEIFKDDPQYQKLYKAHKVAKKELFDYTYKNRESCIKKLETKGNSSEQKEKQFKK